MWLESFFASGLEKYDYAGGWKRNLLRHTRVRNTIWQRRNVAFKTIPLWAGGVDDTLICESQRSFNPLFRNAENKV